METRCYFQRRSVVNRLVKQGLVDESMIKPTTKSYDDPMGYGKLEPYHRDDSDPSRVYVRLTTTLDQLPSMIRGLKFIEVSLHDKLWLIRNRHINQGRGKKGKATYEVSFRQEAYVSEPAHDQFGHDGKSFRDYADVWVRGPNLESVFDCYDNIRSGQTDANWNGGSQER